MQEIIPLSLGSIFVGDFFLFWAPLWSSYPRALGQDPFYRQALVIFHFCTDFDRPLQPLEDVPWPNGEQTSPGPAQLQKRGLRKANKQTTKKNFFHLRIRNLSSPQLRVGWKCEFLRNAWWTCLFGPKSGGFAAATLGGTGQSAASAGHKPDKGRQRLKHFWGCLSDYYLSPMYKQPTNAHCFQWGFPCRIPKRFSDVGWFYFLHITKGEMRLRKGISLSQKCSKTPLTTGPDMTLL